ncbi:hypothetical protein [Rhizobium sp. BK176]|uniref:hypothetical protein n=1 Tax=Rhizobium sp. BK176 TaxID=2587071 RepID=UPI002169E636|nr:hypothetical protein [Rhizobium sp. BK176]MCS4088542.1 hypothetical protein [Rhizobium sp. BK176]
MSETFAVKINGGPEQQLTCRSSYYQEAAVAAIAMLDFERKEDENDVQFVEIWLPDFEERTYYIIFIDEYGKLVVKNAFGLSQEKYENLKKHDNGRYTRLELGFSVLDTEGGEQVLFY